MISCILGIGCLLVTWDAIAVSNRDIKLHFAIGLNIVSFESDSLLVPLLDNLLIICSDYW